MSYENFSMLVDLVQTTTRDGIRLDGSYQATSATTATRFDAVCCVHGTGSNFYGSTMFDAIGSRLLEHGCSVLRINTRGHDGISNASTSSGGRRLGAAYELVDDCRHDLAAWIDWLKQKGHSRIGMIGHSLGAVKCLYAMAHEPNSAVAGVIAISPPRLSYSWFCSGPESTEFLETFGTAEQSVQSGHPGTLLEVKLPLSFVISAGGYVEKYGPDERYNFLNFTRSVRCPTLITFGSIELEKNMAFRGSPEAIAELGNRSGRLMTEIIQGADHFYTSVRGELIAKIEEWANVL